VLPKIVHSAHTGLIRTCSAHKNRWVTTRQLDDGIGDTLVLGLECFAGGHKHFTRLRQSGRRHSQRMQWNTYANGSSLDKMVGRNSATVG